MSEPIKAACGATRNVWGLPLQDDFVSRCDREIHSTFMHCPPEALCATDKADCLHHVPPAEQPEPEPSTEEFCANGDCYGLLNHKGPCLNVAGDPMQPEPDDWKITRKEWYDAPDQVSHSGDCAIWERTVPPLACDCREPVRVVVLSLGDAEAALRWRGHHADCSPSRNAGKRCDCHISRIESAIEAAKGATE
jgi:hypothetical protein